MTVSLSLKHATGTAGDLNFAGVAEQDIVADGYGLVQVWGFVDSIAFSFEADKTVGTEDFATGGSILSQVDLQVHGQVVEI